MMLGRSGKAVKCLVRVADSILRIFGQALAALSLEHHLIGHKCAPLLTPFQYENAVVVAHQPEPTTKVL